MFFRPMDEIKMAAKLIILVENRTCPPGLEEREIGSFKNLSWFCIPSMLAWPEEEGQEGMKTWNRGGT